MKQFFDVGFRMFDEAMELDPEVTSPREKGGRGVHLGYSGALSSNASKSFGSPTEPGSSILL